MVEPIKITKEMQNKRQAEIDRLVAKNNESIKYAMKHNRSNACFTPYPDNQYYSEVRAIFERAGYKIKPTGYIGGVWQLTEDICW